MFLLATSRYVPPVRRVALLLGARKAAGTRTAPAPSQPDDVATLRRSAQAVAHDQHEFALIYAPTGLRPVDSPHLALHDHHRDATQHHG